MAYKSFTVGAGKLVVLVDYPLECPECHYKTIPTHNTNIFSKKWNYLFAFLTCPNPDCDKSYVAEYEATPNSAYYYFKKIGKGTPIKENFPTEIETLSPSFIKIYNEAFTAEQLELLEISGVGFRKALEFLIKDYLIKRYPDKTELIKNIFLGTCIKDLVEDSKVKESAKRAVWLGNDQTHYVKKWEDKDLLDLKKLIKLTVNWIESEIITSELSTSMPE
jgi:Domain of unknown function (DUF4145)